MAVADVQNRTGNLASQRGVEICLSFVSCLTSGDGTGTSGVSVGPTA